MANRSSFIGKLMRAKLLALSVGLGSSLFAGNPSMAQEEAASGEKAVDGPGEGPIEGPVETPFPAPAEAAAAGDPVPVQDDVKEAPADAALPVPMLRLQPAIQVRAAAQVIEADVNVQVQAVEVGAVEVRAAEAVGAAVAIEGGLVVEEEEQNPPHRWVTLDQAGWRYWDRAEAPPENWRSTDFDDSSWQQGPAILGYGDEDVKTRLSFGDDPNAKPLIAYFRLTFDLNELPDVSKIAGRLICDDGAVIYLNDKELYRLNLPEGDLTRESTAVTAISGDQERLPTEFLGDPAAPLVKGKNVIAIQVHQANASSTDLAIALELRGVDDAGAEKVRARIARREQLMGEAAEVAAVQMEVMPARNYIHLSDGNVTYMEANGRTHTQFIDAIEQMASFAPQAKFARAMEGDTLAKLAKQHQIPLDRLSRLNRRSADRPFADNEIFCLSWTYNVMEGDTLAKVASIFMTTPEEVAKLNGLAPDATLQKDQVLQVPGEFTYHHQGDSSYVQLAQYAAVQNVQRDLPYKPESQQMKREQVPESQTLAEYAKSQNLPTKQLAIMNGLEEDAKLEKGQWLLLEFSVEANEGAKLAQIAQMFGIEEEKLRQINDLAADAEPQGGQRLQIPIGERMNQTTGYGGRSPEDVSVLEIRLGDLQ